MTFKEFLDVLGSGWTGWLALFIFFLYIKVWPLVEKRIIPAQIRYAEDQRKQVSDREEEDRKFRQEIERERMESARLTQQAIQAISAAMVQTNERIATILSNQNTILDAINDTQRLLAEGIGDMRAATGISSSTRRDRRSTDSQPGE